MALHAKVRIHYFSRSLLLIALACYITHLNETQALHYYLAPNMQKLLLLCPVPLWFIAIGMLWHTLTGGREKICDCEHPMPTGLFRNVNVYGLFVVPLLFGLLLPDQALGSGMVVKKECCTPSQLRNFWIHSNERVVHQIQLFQLLQTSPGSNRA